MVPPGLSTRRCSTRTLGESTFHALSFRPISKNPRLIISIRSLGQASAAANNWFWNFIISRFTPQMFLTMGYGVYFFFASLMICSVVFVWFLLPETKTIPLEAMDRLFLARPVHKANKIIMEELRMQDEEFRRNVDGLNLREEKQDVDQHESV